MGSLMLMHALCQAVVLTMSGMNLVFTALKFIWFQFICGKRFLTLYNSIPPFSTASEQSQGSMVPSPSPVCVITFFLGGPSP